MRAKVCKLQYRKDCFHADRFSAMDLSTATKDGSVITPVEISSEAESDTAPLVRSKARTSSRSPYIDQFGLQQPPPPSKLFGGDNLHHITEVCT